MVSPSAPRTVLVGRSSCRPCHHSPCRNHPPVPLPGSLSGHGPRSCLGPHALRRVEVRLRSPAWARARSRWIRYGREISQRAAPAPPTPQRDGCKVGRKGTLPRAPCPPFASCPPGIRQAARSKNPTSGPPGTFWPALLAESQGYLFDISISIISGKRRKVNAKPRLISRVLRPEDQKRRPFGAALKALFCFWICQTRNPKDLTPPWNAHDAAQGRWVTGRSGDPAWFPRRVRPADSAGSPDPSRLRNSRIALPKALPVSYPPERERPIPGIVDTAL